MEKIFNFKKGQDFGMDADIIFEISEILCGNSNTIKEDIKITIISETKSNLKDKKGCGRLIPIDPSDKNSEGWYCGHYYDSLKKKMYCEKCRGLHNN
jgi:hypothetical protein